MKVKEIHLQIIIVLMALTLIGLALTKKYLNFPSNEQVFKELGTILFIAGGALFFWNRKLYNDRLAEEKRKKEEDEKKEPEAKE